MSHRSLSLFGVLALAAVLIMLPGDALVSQPAADAAARIHSLQEQRRDTLRQLVEVAKVSYQAGGVPLDFVLQISDSLFEAELELGTTREKRIAILKEQVANLKELEELLTRGWKVGTKRTDERLSAKAARLKAEIQLLREQTSDK